ncbi:hypothetical protein GCM10011352_32890 [Marinobacterium zhoushanense]|uniref:Uncharacterized protein n=1 Tax=Marinobacterium zhoushanense TaxID=1679163 RepID=A0ABQ1KNH1_9GAMM|nr:hypothetical protein GCM10011352_32890 [Marinobacterium zhoushanense]
MLQLAEIGGEFVEFENYRQAQDSRIVNGTLLALSCLIFCHYVHAGL